jgi:hypothetical protein
LVCAALEVADLDDKLALGNTVMDLTETKHFSVKKVNEPHGEEASADHVCEWINSVLKSDAENNNIPGCRLGGLGVPP